MGYMQEISICFNNLHLTNRKGDLQHSLCYLSFVRPEFLPEQFTDTKKMKIHSEGFIVDSDWNKAHKIRSFTENKAYFTHVFSPRIMLK